MKYVQFSNLHTDVPKNLTKPMIAISDDPDTLCKRLSVSEKGHGKAVLNTSKYCAKELGIFIKVREPPRKSEQFTLLKSVHIFKKHRVQYEMRTLYRCLELEHLTGSTADVYLEYDQGNLPEGVAMEVTKTKLERYQNTSRSQSGKQCQKKKREGSCKVSERQLMPAFEMRVGQPRTLKWKALPIEAILSSSSCCVVHMS
ncbi:28S ribosomal protein S10, mitochondrial [Pteropus alecto]|uniref:Small ribosomal subunit protein uS10m n=1 Tax=Pteropus alecto TaxID=9402 RepID=L5KYF3_PTEAL|nr:28S ribosomal protein S10, mitochondrial [Pteropus alecto]